MKHNFHPLYLTLMWESDLICPFFPPNFFDASDFHTFPERFFIVYCFVLRPSFPLGFPLGKLSCKFSLFLKEMAIRPPIARHTSAIARKGVCIS